MSAFFQKKFTKILIATTFKIVFLHKFPQKTCIRIFPPIV